MGIKCDDICPNCKFADLTNDRCTFDNASYEKGRADKYQEIVSEYMLLTEKQVEDIMAEERAKVLDDVIKTLAKSEDTMLSDKQYYTLMDKNL